MSQLDIDINRKTLDLYLLREDVKGSVKTRKLQNDVSAVDMVIAWLNKQHYKPEDIRIIMEATSAYHESLAYGLYKAEGWISLANPHRAREFTRGMGVLTKNDWVDAYTLAYYGTLEASEPWSPPPEEVRRLNALFHKRDTFVADSTHEKNRLEKYLATDIPSVIAESVEAMIGQLSTEIKRLDRLTRLHLNQCPGLKEDFDLLASIKSVGYQLGLNILVILWSHDLTIAERVVVLLGVVPVGKYPGTPVGGCLKPSEIDPPEIRVKLYLTLLCGPRLNPLMKTTYKQLYLRGKGKMCAIGALMRKLMHWCYGVLEAQKPLDVGYLSSCVRSMCKAA